MATYTLTRDTSSDEVTFGELRDDAGNLLCETLELPWKDNHPGESCVPTGSYDCAPHDSAAHPHTWELTNVPGRTAILIHNGNTAKDSLGCIIVGATRGQLNGEPAVLTSNATLDKLRGILPQNFTIVIR